MKRQMITSAIVIALGLPFSGAQAKPKPTPPPPPPPTSSKPKPAAAPEIDAAAGTLAISLAGGMLALVKRSRRKLDS